jgi:hypothetical protein
MTVVVAEFTSGYQVFFPLIKHRFFHNGLHTGIGLTGKISRSGNAKTMN